MAIGFSSCAYDPYATTTVGGSYSSGYGGGYDNYGGGYGNYGGGSVSTSLFVSTGDPRWGYDPYSYSYYDYSRRSYYDPYLHGYYPVGYRPTAVYGVPHPYGWSSGHGHIRPPSHYSDHRLSDYRDRAGAYRNTNYDWAKQVRQRPSEPRVIGTHQSQDRSSNRYEPRQSRGESSRQPSRSIQTRPDSRREGNSHANSRFNTPVSMREQPGRSSAAPQRQQSRRQEARPAARENRGGGGGRGESRHSNSDSDDGGHKRGRH